MTVCSLPIIKQRASLDGNAMHASAGGVTSTPIKSEFLKPKSEFVTEMSKNNRFRINGLSRDPGSMNFGTLLKRHPKYGLLQSHLKLELSSTCFLSVTGTYQERFSLEA